MTKITHICDVCKKESERIYVIEMIRKGTVKTVWIKDLCYSCLLNVEKITGNNDLPN